MISNEIPLVKCQFSIDEETLNNQVKKYSESNFYLNFGKSNNCKILNELDLDEHTITVFVTCENKDIEELQDKIINAILTEELCDKVFKTTIDKNAAGKNTVKPQL